MDETNLNYIGCSITDIRRGKGLRSCFFYAKVIGADGTSLITADLDYCVEAVKTRMPEHGNERMLKIRRVIERWDYTKHGGVGQLAEAIDEALNAE